jgi:hypothetical protein
VTATGNNMVTYQCTGGAPVTYNPMTCMPPGGMNPMMQPMCTMGTCP